MLLFVSRMLMLKTVWSAVALLKRSMSEHRHAIRCAR